METGPKARLEREVMVELWGMRLKEQKETPFTSTEMVGQGYDALMEALAGDPSRLDRFIQDMAPAAWSQGLRSYNLILAFLAFRQVARDMGWPDKKLVRLDDLIYQAVLVITRLFEEFLSLPPTSPRD